MKIIKISGTLGRTINLGNFNSMRIEASVEVELDSPDEIEEARAAIIAEARESLKQQHAAIKPPKAKK